MESSLAEKSSLVILRCRWYHIHQRFFYWWDTDHVPVFLDLNVTLEIDFTGPTGFPLNESHEKSRASLGKSSGLAVLQCSSLLNFSVFRDFAMDFAIHPGRHWWKSQPVAVSKTSLALANLGSAKGVVDQIPLFKWSSSEMIGTSLQIMDKQI